MISCSLFLFCTLSYCKRNQFKTILIPCQYHFSFGMSCRSSCGIRSKIWGFCVTPVVFSTSMQKIVFLHTAGLIAGLQLAGTRNWCTCVSVRWEVIRGGVKRQSGGAVSPLAACGHRDPIRGTQQFSFPTLQPVKRRDGSLPKR